MSKTGRTNKNYDPQFKIHVILDMTENHLSYRETVRKYWHTQNRTQEENYLHTLRHWKQIFLEEGVDALMQERRGRKSKGRPPKKALPQSDLIAENQRLKKELEYAKMEIEYLKKLDALVRAENLLNGKR